WARYSSRLSPRIPVLTMSSARMLRSELCACESACFAASSLDVLELPTSSMIFTTATELLLLCVGGNGALVLSGSRARRGSARRPRRGAVPGTGDPRADDLGQGGPLPRALDGIRGGDGGGLGEELLDRGRDRRRLGARGRRRDDLDPRPRRSAL